MFVWSLLIGLPLILGEEASATLFDGEVLGQAEAAFRRGMEEQATGGKASFQRSATLFQELAGRGFQNEALYRNLGNAYLLSGDLPRAILAYRLGLRFAPHNRDLRAGLAWARERVASSTPDGFGKPPAPDRFPPWLSSPPPALLLGIAVFGYTLAWCGMGKWLMARRPGYLAWAIGTLVVSAIPALGLGIQAWNSRQETSHPVLVIAVEGVQLRKGNGVAYPPRYETTLHPGVEARLLFERSDWLMIELTGGEVGWVAKSDVVVE